MSGITKSIASVLAVATLISATDVGSAHAQLKKSQAGQSLKQAKPQAAINLKTNRIGRPALAKLIRQKARTKGVKLSAAEVNQAVNAGMGKLSTADPGAQKGIIHIDIGRITICIAWGKDKGHC